MEWEKIYRDCTAPEAMKRLIEKIQSETEADVMMLSHVRFSHYVTAKEAWLEKEYGDVFTGRCYGCGTRSDKLHFLQMLCEYYECSPADIVLVEDNDETIQECRKAGFVVLDTINVLLHNGEISFGSGGSRKNDHTTKAHNWKREQLEAARRELSFIRSIGAADQVIRQCTGSNTYRDKINFLQELSGCQVDVAQLGEECAYWLLLSHVLARMTNILV